MKRKIIKSIIIFVLLLSLGIGIGILLYKPHTAPVSDVSGTQDVGVPEEEKAVKPPDCTVTDEDLLTGINSARTNIGLRPVKLSPKLDAYAEQRATEMDGVDFSHNGFDSTKYSFQTSNGYKGVGENLAKGYCPSNIIIDAWMNSPTHKQVMLDPRFVDIGISTYKGFTVTNYGGY